MSIRAAVLMAVVWSSLAPSVAFGQGESEERARALFEAGRVAVQEGDYEAAYRYFTDAYESSQRAVLLFNIASAAERIDREDEAVVRYREYLAQVPDAENRAYVEGRIRALENRHSDEGEPEPSTTSTPPPADAAAPQTAERDASSGGSEPVAGYVLIAAGAAVAVAGAVMLGVGVAERANVDDSPVGSVWSDYEGSHDLANTLTPTGGVALGIGVALAVTGVVVTVAGGGGDEQVALRVGPTSVALSGSFE